MRAFCWSLVALCTAAPGCAPRVEDCWNGLGLGEHIELQIVDVYVEGGPYTWSAYVDPGWPGCAGRDGLMVGSQIEMELVSSVGVTGCREYIARPLTGVTGVDFSGVLSGGGGGAVVSSSTGYCGGFWEIQGIRLAQEGRNPLGESAMTGRLPPVIVQRTMTGTCGASCVDYWVGEVRLIAAPDGGGPDGGH